MGKASRAKRERRQTASQTGKGATVNLSALMKDAGRLRIINGGRLVDPETMIKEAIEEDDWGALSTSIAICRLFGVEPLDMEFTISIRGAVGFGNIYELAFTRAAHDCLLWLIECGMAAADANLAEFIAVVFHDLEIAAEESPDCFMFKSSSLFYLRQLTLDGSMERAEEALSEAELAWGARRPRLRALLDQVRAERLAESEARELEREVRPAEMAGGGADGVTRVASMARL